MILFFYYLCKCVRRSVYVDISVYMVVYTGEFGLSPVRGDGESVVQIVSNFVGNQKHLE